MSQAAAQEERWEGSPDSRQGSPARYATPPMTELLYDTTVDELVRVKDERDMLMSEVEVLRNQLKNRDNTLAMLSGYVRIFRAPFASTPEHGSRSGSLRNVLFQKIKYQQWYLVQKTCWLLSLLLLQANADHPAHVCC